MHQQATAILRGHGLEVYALGAPAKIHRTRTADKPKSEKNGWYIYHPTKRGGLIVTFGIWHTGQKQSVHIRADGGKTPSRAPAPDFVDLEALQKAQEEQQKERAQALAHNTAIWSNAQPIGDTLGVEYLRRRGIDPDPQTLTGLRFAPSLPYYEDGKARPFPAIVANVQTLTGQTVSLLRIYLDPKTAGKAPVATPKKLTRASAPMGGAFVVLGDITADVLGIAEGVETALSASQLSGVPVMAGVSAYGLANFDPPNTCARLLYFADNDANGTGQLHAQQGAQRVARRGILTQIATPPEGVKDFNDLLQAQA